MRNPSQMLPLKVIILASILATPSLGVVTDDKCKCLMCVCDVDPHPHPPALPSHHHPPPPPEEPEPTPEYYYPPPPEEPEPETTPVYYYPPPPEEPEPTPVHYYYPPPPQEPYEYSPSTQGAYWPPTPVMGIVGTPGQMYPRDSAFIPSAADRRRCHGLPSCLILAVLLMSGALSLLAFNIQ